jgi:hypothetical protein
MYFVEPKSQHGEFNMKKLQNGAVQTFVTSPSMSATGQSTTHHLLQFGISRKELYV